MIFSLSCSGSVRRTALEETQNMDAFIMDPYRSCFAGDEAPVKEIETETNNKESHPHDDSHPQDESVTHRQDDPDSVKEEEQEGYEAEINGEIVSLPVLPSPPHMPY